MLQDLGFQREGAPAKIEVDSGHQPGGLFVATLALARDNTVSPKQLAERLLKLPERSLGGLCGAAGGVVSRVN